MPLSPFAGTVIQESRVGYAVPTSPPETNTCADLLNKPLAGWEETRDTLSCIEELRRSGNGSAIVEVVDRNTESGIRAAFRTVAELDEYVKSNFRHTLLDGAKGTLTLEDPKQTMSEEIVSGQVRLE